MALEREQIYTYVQDLFQRGLVIVVGSGASAAFGLPGMAALADHLVKTVPREISTRSLGCLPQWSPVSELLGKGAGLEEALADGIASDELSDLIAQETAACIAEHELHAITQILSSENVPAFSRVFQHILRISDRIDVVTTNYDRLLEAQAARVGIGVDTMFYGHTIGKFNPEQSRADMLRPMRQVGKRASTSFRMLPHIRLSKPHGSLDWFTFNGEHFRSDLVILGSRRIVAPGRNKYRLGYDAPFDQQRERANAAIRSASALLFVGYGFNDDHLQTRIKEKIRNVPTVVVARTLTKQAKQYLSTNPSALGIEADSQNDAVALISRGNDQLIVQSPLWDLDYLVQEVLAK